MVQLTWRFFFGIATYTWYTYFFNEENGERNRKAVQAWWDNLTVDQIMSGTVWLAGKLGNATSSLWEGGLDGLSEWGEGRLVSICFACLIFKALGQFFKKRAERNGSLVEMGPEEPPKPAAAAATKQKKRK